MISYRFRSLHYAVVCLFIGFQSTTQQGCTHRPADVIFLLDSSASVGKDSFETEKQFILNFTKSVKIGTQDVQVGIVKYATDPNTEVRLNESNSETDLIYAINNITYVPGGTRTHQALKYVYDNGFTIHGGDRSSAPNFLVVLTDGLSFYGQATFAEAQRLHNASVTVYAIGIGEHINKTELTRIATDRNHMFIVPDYNALHELQKELYPIACHSATLTTLPPIVFTQPPNPCNSGPCHFGHCFHDDLNYVCMCQPGYHGKNCDQDLCSGSPCKNGGKCYHNINDYVCICNAGYSGKNCENAPTARPGFCTSKPCLHGGVCYEDALKFICICQPGYAGTQCQNVKTTTTPGFKTTATQVQSTTTKWIVFPQNGAVGR